MFGAKQRLVAGKVNHDMRMPMARRSKHLVRRPHVGKTHFWALGDLAFDVSGLYALYYGLGAIEDTCCCNIPQESWAMTTEAAERTHGQCA